MNREKWGKVRFIFDFPYSSHCLISIQVCFIYGFFLFFYSFYTNSKHFLVWVQWIDLDFLGCSVAFIVFLFLLLMLLLCGKTTPFFGWLSQWKIYLVVKRKNTDKSQITTKDTIAKIQIQIAIISVY